MGFSLVAWEMRPGFVKTYSVVYNASVSLIALRATVLLMAMASPFISTATAQATVPGAHRYWAYIGNSGSDGIGLFKLDADAGTLVPAGIAAEAGGPGFLAVSPNQKYLFAVVTLKMAKGNVGGVRGFSINASSGKLTLINEQLSGGNGPAFISVDPSGRNVLVANYGSATVSVLPIDAEGRLAAASCVVQQSGSSVDPGRQTHAYAHSINCDPTGKFAISCDLGADKLFVYRFDAAAGKLLTNDPPWVSVTPGAGPRHLTFSGDGKFLYMLNEMGATVNVYRFDSESGGLAELQTIGTLKEDTKGNTSAEVQIDPSGRFLYASNRLTTNYVTIFSIDQKSGKLTLVGYQDSLGKTPRNFRIDPTGRYLLLANQDSNTVVLFAIDGQTGRLSAVGGPMATVSLPSCVKFVEIKP